MARNQLGFDSKEFEQRLNEIAADNQEAVMVLASRCALRVFPLLVDRGGFHYWIKTDKEITQDNRTKHLLGLWRAVGFSWLGDVKAAAKYSRYAYAAAYDADEAYTYFPDVINAAYSVACSADPTATPTSAFITATRSVSTHGYVGVDDFALEVESDIEILESTNRAQSLRNKPLWLKIPRAIGKVLKSHWLTGLKSLAADEAYHENQELAEDILAIHDQYALILSGEADPKKLANVVHRISIKPTKNSNSKKKARNKLQREIWGLEKTDQIPAETVTYINNPVYSPETLIGEDCLNRHGLAQAIANILSADKNKQHLTIGLLGDWGSGKSFLLKLIKQQLPTPVPHLYSDGVGFLYGEFNAWAYEHTDNIQAGVTQEAVTALTGELSFIRKLILTVRFAWRLKKPYLILSILLPMLIILLGWYVTKEGLDFAGLDGLLGLVGLGSLAGWIAVLKDIIPHPFARKLHTYLRLPTYGKHLGTIPIMQEQLKVLSDIRLGENSCKYTHRQTRLMYVVDDLDRCTPQGIVKTFEAIRLVMDIPQVTVFIAVDHRIALSALAQHYAETAEYYSGRTAMEIARDYLAKVIHLPVKLADPDTDTVHGFLVNALWGGNDPLELGEVAQSSSAVKSDISETDKTSPVDVFADDSKTLAVQGKNATARVQLEIPDLTIQLPSDSVEIKKIIGSSPQHKRAFSYWVQIFGFVNPRQIKRLHNSYSLMQHYYPGDDELLDFDDTKDKESVEKLLAGTEINFELVNERYQKHAYPRMVGLFLLEYINELPAEIRAKFHQAQGEYFDMLDILEDKEIYAAFIVLHHAPSWMAEVQSFVLPAIETEITKQMGN